MPRSCGGPAAGGQAEGAIGHDLPFDLSLQLPIGKGEELGKRTRIGKLSGAAIRKLDKDVTLVPANDSALPKHLVHDFLINKVHGASP